MNILDKWEQDYEEIKSALDPNVKRKLLDQLRGELVKSLGKKKAKEKVDALVWSSFGLSVQGLIDYAKFYFEKHHRKIESNYLNSFWGDLVYASAYNDIEAAERLIISYFPEGALFHPLRWAILRPYLIIRIRETREPNDEIEEKEWKEIWNEICISALFLSIKSIEEQEILKRGIIEEEITDEETAKQKIPKRRIPLFVVPPFDKQHRDDQKLDPSYWYRLRAEMGREIERDLLNGLNSDNQESKDTETIYEDFDYKGFDDERTPSNLKAEELESFMPEEVDTRPSVFQMPPISAWLLDEIRDYGIAIDALNEKEKLILLADIANRSNLKDDPLERTYITRYTDEELDYFISQTDEKLATRFSVNIATIRQLRHRAKEKLRKILDQ